MPNIPLALVPGHIGNKSKDTLRRDVLGVTLQAVVDNLTQAPALRGELSEPGARDIVVKGGFKADKSLFLRPRIFRWSADSAADSEEIGSFLRFTDRSPDEVLRRAAAR